MRNVIFFVILILIIATLIWWFTSDNATAPVVDGVIQYNQDSGAFEQLMFRLDCYLVRNGSFNTQSITCLTSQ